MAFYMDSRDQTRVLRNETSPQSIVTIFIECLFTVSTKINIITPRKYLQSNHKENVVQVLRLYYLIAQPGLQYAVGFEMLEVSLRATLKFQFKKITIV